jgi:hypothetical protein
MLNEGIMDYSVIFLSDLKINKKNFRIAHCKSVLLGQELYMLPHDCRIRPHTH